METDGRTIVQVDKVQAAHRQLDAAIALHFQRGDAVAVHTLAGAASMIFADLSEQAPEGNWDEIACQANGISKSEYFGVMRRVQNFLKHGKRDTGGVIDVDSSETEDLIFFATLNIPSVSTLSAPQQVFQIWFLAVRSDHFSEGPHVLDALRFFPGIRQDDEGRQRQRGREVLALQQKVFGQAKVD